MIFLYSLTIFVSATLLFLVQPLFARMLLPALGGSPAVWNTVLVFFQAALLAGYAYAHASTSWLGARRQAAMHLAVLLLPVLFLPLALPSPLAPPTNSTPVPWLLGVMLVSVGVPFFAISTTSPLLQKWFAASGHVGAADPYFLYAASNLGSMLALLGYPLWVEPNLRLGDQSRLWAIGYVGLVVLLAFCALWLWKSSPVNEVETPPSALFEAEKSVPADSLNHSLNHSSNHSPNASPNDSLTNAQRVRWILLSFVPSSLMISVTTYLSTDIAAIPLLWVVPLAIYLLTFILVFAGKPVPHGLSVRAVPLVLLPLVVAMAARATQPIALLMAFHLVALFAIALACHGELAANRPAPRHLTEFYLWLSVGGVLGGAFNALLAPLAFKGVWEYPITLVLACILVLRAPQIAHGTEKTAPLSNGPLSNGMRSRWLDFALPVGIGALTLGSVLFFEARGLISGPMALGPMFGLPALLCFPMSRRGVRFGLSIGAILLAATFYGGGQIGRVLTSDRSFFGVHRVTLSPSGTAHQILHGNTIHGVQSLFRPREAQAYYHRRGPVGQIFAAVNRPENPLSRANRRVGVTGLGAGGISCYARRGEAWTFYEIDPVVVQIARDSRYFTYLRDCPAKLDVVLGDGRLTLSKAQGSTYDLLILDAYSSDSLPVHLITREALALYKSKLAPGGLLIFNISNRNLKLETTLGNLAADAQLVSLAQDDGAISASEAAAGQTASQWVVMARRRADLGALLQNSRFQPTRIDPTRPVWTDDFSSVLSVFNWD